MVCLTQQSRISCLRALRMDFLFFLSKTVEAPASQMGAGVEVSVILGLYLFSGKCWQVIYKFVRAMVQMFFGFVKFLIFKGLTSSEGNRDQETKKTARSSLKESVDTKKDTPLIKQRREQMDATSMMSKNNVIEDIGNQLGVAVATVLVEVLDEDYWKTQVKPRDLPRLLGAAIEESLEEVSHAESDRLSKAFERSFRTAYNTMLSVKRKRYQQKKEVRSPRTEEFSSSQTQPENGSSYSQTGSKPKYLKKQEDDMEKRPAKVRLSSSQTRSNTKGLNTMATGELQRMASNHCRFDSSLQRNIESNDSQIHHYDSEIKKTESVRSGLTGTSNLHPRVNTGDNMHQQTETNISRFAMSRESHAAGHSEYVKKRDSQSSEENATTSKGYGENKSHCIAFGRNPEHADNRTDQKVMPMFPSMPNEAMVSAALSNSELSNDSHFRQNLLSLFNKSVEEYEMENRLNYIELMQKEYGLELGIQLLKAQMETTKLMQEEIMLNKSEVSWKEGAFTDQQVNEKCMEHRKACGSELVSVLLLSLFSAGYGVYRCSRALLAEAFQSSQFTKVSKKRTWHPNPMKRMASVFAGLFGRMRVFSHVVAGVLVAFTLVVLLTNYPLPSSSQTMPASTTLVILEGACVLAGKFVVDSLGGNGFYWLMYWEALCILHLLAGCFTPSVYSLSNGSPTGSTSSSSGSQMIPYWLRNIVFHATIILLLVLAVLASSGSPHEWMHHLYVILDEHVVHPSNEALRATFNLLF